MDSSDTTATLASGNFLGIINVLMQLRKVGATCASGPWGAVQAAICAVLANAELVMACSVSQLLSSLSRGIMHVQSTGRRLPACKMR